MQPFPCLCVIESEALRFSLLVMIKVPLDFVNAIVALSYKVKSGAILAKYDRLFNEGIITEEMLHGKSLQLSDHFIPGIYELQDSINLFLHIYAIVMNSHGARNSNLELLHTPCSRPEHEKKNSYIMAY